MAVLASKRGISEMEFYKQALELRKNAVALLMRDFGIKTTAIFDDSTDGAKWYINFERNRIANLCAELIDNIIKANGIYVNTDYDYEQKRMYQNYAISTVNTLLEEFMHIIEVIHFEKLHKALKVFVENCEQELILLKAWRKKNKKVNHSASRSNNQENAQNTQNNPQEPFKEIDQSGTISLDDDFFTDLEL